MDGGTTISYYFMLFEIELCQELHGNNNQHFLLLLYYDIYSYDY